MPEPHEVLNVKRNASAQEIRAAYHALVKVWHPDTIMDPERREEANRKLIEINLAYEQALRPFHREIVPDPQRVASSLLGKGQLRAALSILSQAIDRDSEWFFLQGKILMRMGNPQTAMESFRAAVRLDPSNNEYRKYALDAEVARRKSETLAGRFLRWARNSVIPFLAGKAKV